MVSLVEGVRSKSQAREALLFKSVVPAFKNEYVTMLKVYIPPGRTAAYHKHSIDFVSCWVEAAQIRVQVLGLDPTEPKVPTGAVVYNGYTKKPIVHQVSNIDSKPFQCFEIMYT